ncbi:histone-lysine N-methyltransferase SETMAR-like, partial [Stegodyphus dumicola]|uniref:histone-lysine N-methyltransferase SETMAR-like n=1 Tax=Stegodyphus dumicola TaxID=202533 RepID=UPI0015B2A34C
CNTLRKLTRAIQNKRRCVLTPGVLFLHDSARPHSSQQTHDFLRLVFAEQMERVSVSPYIPDLAPSDHLLPAVKKWLRTQHFAVNENLMYGNWLKSQEAEFYTEGIDMLPKRYDKRLNKNASYVENGGQL